MQMPFKTADLCDAYAGDVQICEPLFGDFGGRLGFHGQIVTVRCFEDNSKVREALDEAGAGRVLVIDGGGSRRCAMLGDLLAARAVANGWSGVLLNGMLRDAAEIAQMPLGVKALGTHPLKSEKRGLGDRQVAVCFAGVRFVPGEYLYADRDGVVCSSVALQ